MARRVKLTFHLQGHTFEEVIADKRSLAILCEACQRRVVWPLAEIIARGLKGYVYKTAEKLRCSNCGASDLIVTVHIPPLVRGTPPQRFATRDRPRKPTPPQR